MLDFDASELTTMKHPWVSTRSAQSILTYLHFAYPLILLAFFITIFTLRSILTASKDNTVGATEEHIGPGGKPLPKKISTETRSHDLDFSRPRKLLFMWLALGAALTFVGTAITIIVHALYARSEQWWCGQSVVVSLKPLQGCQFMQLTILSL